MSTWKKNSSNPITTLLLLVMLLFNSLLFASQDSSPPSLSGYDVVSYFTKHKAERGNSQHTTVYKDKTYWFSSEKHKNLFIKQPARYLPQYDGYCAFGVQYGQKIKASPEAWAIVDNKLYLNTDKSYLKKWKSDVAGSIREGNKQWSMINSD
jgi:YHS domain-containing protein